MPGLFADLVDWVERLVDLTYAAGASGDFALDGASYRDGYARLYDLYQRVHAARVSIEERAAAVDPTAVTRSISGVYLGSSTARESTGGDLNSPGSMAMQLRDLEGQLSGLLSGMHAAYYATAATDAQAAARIAGARA